MEDRRLLLILNPCAGQRRANRVLPEILRALLDAGYRCETYITAASGDATRYAAAHAAEFDRIVCAGGDGTLNETIAGVLASGAGVPIGYIPCGTTNDYASSIGLSSDVLQAARDAVGGEPHRLDVGLFNGRYAPTRVKMLSTMPISATAAGTKQPIWAMMVMMAVCRM